MLKCWIFIWQPQRVLPSLFPTDNGLYYYYTMGLYFGASSVILTHILKFKRFLSQQLNYGYIDVKYLTLDNLLFFGSPIRIWTWIIIKMIIHKINSFASCQLEYRRIYLMILVLSGGIEPLQICSIFWFKVRNPTIRWREIGECGGNQTLYYIVLQTIALSFCHTFILFYWKFRLELHQYLSLINTNGGSILLILFFNSPFLLNLTYMYCNINLLGISPILYFYTFCVCCLYFFNIVFNNVNKFIS